MESYVSPFEEDENAMESCDEEPEADDTMDSEDIDRDDIAPEGNVSEESYDFEEGMDEETFRAIRAAFDKKMEQDSISFVSWNISRSCFDIAAEIDNLEKVIVRKPYVGLMMRAGRNAARQPINDPISIRLYNNEKQRLEELLKKHQER